MKKIRESKRDVIRCAWEWCAAWPIRAMQYLGVLWSQFALAAGGKTHALAIVGLFVCVWALEKFPNSPNLPAFFMVVGAVCGFQAARSTMEDRFGPGGGA